MHGKRREMREARNERSEKREERREKRKREARRVTNVVARACGSHHQCGGVFHHPRYIAAHPRQKSAARGGYRKHVSS
jgi:hypothetical protein